MSAQALVRAEPFGRLNGGIEVRRYTLGNAGFSAALVSLGATLQSLTVPGPGGACADVVLGFAQLSDYIARAARETYPGAVVGRFAGRIAGSRFTLDGAAHRLAANQPGYTLHGGPDGFDARVWQPEPLPGADLPSIRFSLLSEDGDQGFPGRVRVDADYLLDGAGRLWLELTATSLEPAGGRATVVNLTNHAYFNLAGEGAGTVEDQLLTIPASRYTLLGPDLLPTGELAPVDGTPLDFREPLPIGQRLTGEHQQLRVARGYDHTWVLDPDAPVLAAPPPAGLTGAGELRLALRATDPGSGRQLAVWTDQPGVHVFVANTFDGSLRGKSGARYPRWAGFTAETQHFPDSPNQPAFPSTVLPAGATFRTTTVFAVTAGPG